MRLPLLASVLLGLLVASAPARAAELRRPAALALVDRLTWGANASTLAAVEAAGIERWIEGQLHPRPEDGLPPAAAAQVEALGLIRRPLLDTVAELDAQTKAANAIPDPDQKRTAQQAYQGALGDLAKAAAHRAILRALYSPAQVRERMVWFWFNHFNIHQGKANLRALIGDYEERAIRPHALGRFRDLLGAVVRHPAMLRYLDNAENAAGRLNENHARELLELHTLGVGSGYTQGDVEALARILTGLGIDARAETPKLRPELQGQLVRDGLFLFNPARHDQDDKVFLGHTIRGRGLAEVDEALDLLSRHPATARLVARKLATYLVADAPPEALVQRMAQVFLHTDGDISAVLGVMIRSPEFAASLGAKVKDPVAYTLSAVRLAYDDRVVLSTAPIQGWLNRLGEGLYNRQTPDGYPLTASAWTGPGQLAARFEVARQIGSGPAGLFKPDPASVERPGFPQLQNALYWTSLRDRLDPATRAVLDQAVSPQDWNTLFLASPEFMQH